MNIGEKILIKKTEPEQGSGPDGVRVLKLCAEQLCGALQHLFNLSLTPEKVPLLWKTSCLVLVPKKTPGVLERLLLAHLCKLTSTDQDPCSLLIAMETPSCTCFNKPTD